MIRTKDNSIDWEKELALPEEGSIRLEIEKANGPAQTLDMHRDLANLLRRPTPTWVRLRPQLTAGKSTQSSLGVAEYLRVEIIGDARQLNLVVSVLSPLQPGKKEVLHTKRIELGGPSNSTLPNDIQRELKACTRESLLKQAKLSAGLMAQALIYEETHSW